MINVDSNSKINKVLFNNVIPIGMVGDMHVETNFGLNINTYYYNLTERDFTIVTREGIPYSLMPSKKSQFRLPANSSEHNERAALLEHHEKTSNKIVVRKQYVLLNKDFKKFKSFVESENHPDHSFIKYLYKTLCDVSFDKKPMMGVLHIPDLIDNAKVSVTIDSILDPFKDNIGRDDIYYTDEDIVVSFKDISEASSHPVTNAQSKIHVNDDAYKNNDIFVTYDLISNKNDMVQFVNISGHVTKIKSRKDNILSEGLYKNIYCKNIQNGTHKLIEGFKVNLENMDTLGVYPTRDIAEARGNLDDARKEKIKELEYELTVLSKNADMQLVELKRELEITKKNNTEQEMRSKTELENLRSELESKKNKLTEEALITKNYYDERSHNRKDTSESLKLAPTLITGAIGVAGALGTVMALKATAGVVAAPMVAGLTVMKTLGITALLATAVLAANKLFKGIGEDSMLGRMASGIYDTGKSFVSSVWNGVKSVGNYICDGVSNFFGGLFSW